MFFVKGTIDGEFNMFGILRKWLSGSSEIRDKPLDIRILKELPSITSIRENEQNSLLEKYSVLLMDLVEVLKKTNAEDIDNEMLLDNDKRLGVVVSDKVVPHSIINNSSLFQLLKDMDLSDSKKRPFLKLALSTKINKVYLSGHATKIIKLDEERMREEIKSNLIHYFESLAALILSVSGKEGVYYTVSYLLPVLQSSLSVIAFTVEAYGIEAE